MCRRISNFWCGVLAVLMAGAARGEPAADAAALLKEVTPDHVVHLNSLISATGGKAAPAELLGYNLAVGGQRVVGVPLTYAEGSTLEFEFYWIPREIPREKLSVRVRISGSGPVIEQVSDVETAGWQVGVVSRQRVELRHARGLYSGQAQLTVALLVGDSKPYIMYSCPVFIATANVPSKLYQTLLQDAGVTPLNTAFRLGKGASTIVTPNAADDNYKGIMIVSATSYDGDPNEGEAVCRVEAPGAVDANLVTGIDTGPSQMDLYIGMGSTNLPVQMYSAEKGILDFVTVVKFSKPCRPDQITFKYLKDKGVIDVKGLALVKADE